jgi:DNA-directed RNA polymerase specialized sigma24 family protein
VIAPENEPFHSNRKLFPVNQKKSNGLREMAAYSIGEAAHYLRIPVATLRSWVRGCVAAITRLDLAIAFSSS